MVVEAVVALATVPAQQAVTATMKNMFWFKKHRSSNHPLTMTVVEQQWVWQ